MILSVIKLISNVLNASEIKLSKTMQPHESQKSITKYCANFVWFCKVYPTTYLEV